MVILPKKTKKNFIFLFRAFFSSFKIKGFQNSSWISVILTLTRRTAVSASEWTHSNDVRCLSPPWSNLTARQDWINAWESGGRLSCWHTTVESGSDVGSCYSADRLIECPDRNHEVQRWQAEPGKQDKILINARYHLGSLPCSPGNFIKIKRQEEKKSGRETIIPFHRKRNCSLSWLFKVCLARHHNHEVEQQWHIWFLNMFVSSRLANHNYLVSKPNIQPFSR